MRTETKYFAFDETEFDTEAECLAYEKKLEGLWDGVDYHLVSADKIGFEPQLVIK